MTRTAAAIDRFFGRTEKILEAIEAGEDPAPVMQEASDAAPWDLISISQAFAKDALEAEIAADEGTDPAIEV